MAHTEYSKGAGIRLAGFGVRLDTRKWRSAAYSSATTGSAYNVTRPVTLSCSILAPPAFPALGQPGGAPEYYASKGNH